MNIFHGKIHYIGFRRGNGIMPHIFVRQKMADYPKWKRMYDEHGAARRATGSKGARLIRNADDPDDA
jgi:hypothetical protein